MGIGLIAVTRVIGAGLIPGNISGRLSYWPGELRRGSRHMSYETKQRLFGVRRNYYSTQGTSNHRSRKVKFCVGLLLEIEHVIDEGFS